MSLSLALSVLTQLTWRQNPLPPIFSLCVCVCVNLILFPERGLRGWPLWRRSQTLFVSKTHLLPMCVCLHFRQRETELDFFLRSLEDASPIIQKGREEGWRGEVQLATTQHHDGDLHDWEPTRTMKGAERGGTLHVTPSSTTKFVWTHPRHRGGIFWGQSEDSAAVRSSRVV